jgi:hypothetical protein
MFDAQGNGMRKKLFVCIFFLICTMRNAFAACIDLNSAICLLKQFCHLGDIVDNPAFRPVTINAIRQDTYGLPKYGQPPVWYGS